MVDTTQIREHAEVRGNDGVHIGTVDHLDGANQIKLTKKDPDAGGQHHFISLDDVQSIDADGALVLKMNAEDAKRAWTAG